MNSLKVTAIPLDIVWADKDENLYATSRILATVDKDTDVVVLPELFSTGFLSSPELLSKYAEDASDSPTVAKILEWAKHYNFAISGSLLVKDNGNFINRGFFVEPSGDMTFYDKTHLFRLSSEAEHFTPGNETIPVIRYRGWNIAMAICYEVRFPVWLRNRHYEYDLLLVPANWPVKRAYAWKHLLIARAIENQAFVVGANRSGKDDSGQYDGLTYIFNYLGKPIGNVAETPSGLVSAVLDRDKLNAYRESFPVDEDSDSFVLRR